jgi:putative ABC transport system permease protein
VQNVGQAPLMAQVAASGLIVSFALTVSMVTMVSSFRVALDQWLDAVLPAPFYMRSKGRPAARRTARRAGRPAAVPSPASSAWPSEQLSLDPRRPPAALLVRELDRAGPGARLPFTRAVFTAPAASIPVWISEADAGTVSPATRPALRLPLLGREVEVSSAASGATIRASSAPW